MGRDWDSQTARSGCRKISSISKFKTGQVWWGHDGYFVRTKSLIQAQIKTVESAKILSKFTATDIQNKIIYKDH